MDLCRDIIMQMIQRKELKMNKTNHTQTMSIWLLTFAGSKSFLGPELLKSTLIELYYYHLYCLISESRLNYRNTSLYDVVQQPLLKRTKTPSRVYRMCPSAFNI